MRLKANSPIYNMVLLFKFISVGNPNYYPINLKFISHTLKLCAPCRMHVFQKQSPGVSVGTLLDDDMCRSDSQESQRGPLASHCEASWKHSKHFYKRFIKIKETESFTQPNPLIMILAIPWNRMPVLSKEFTWHSLVCNTQFSIILTFKKT